MTNQEAWRLYAAYLAAWNTTAIDERAKIAGEVLSENVAYQTPKHDLGTGRAPILDDMAAFHEQFPGGHFEIGDVSAHHDVALLTWVIIQADGTVFAQGGDQITIGEDGRIAKIITFAPSAKDPG